MVPERLVGMGFVVWTVSLVSVGLVPGLLYAQETAPGDTAGASSKATPVTSVELGLRCIDGKDNDGNGLVDCDEPACQGEAFCLERIYYVPEPADKPMGMLLALGAGLALPNWNPPESDAQEDAAGNPYLVPYLPDVGPVLDLTVMYFFHPFVGVGMKGMFAGTSVQSREKWYEDDFYKFDGLKVFLNYSALLRFQYPLRRFVPYVNIALGYTYVQYRWATFTRFGDDGGALMTLDRIVEPPSRHMTFALALGADLYVLPRELAVGIKIWLPVAATGGAGMDNTGLLLTVTYTPMWKEKKTIRPEYREAYGIQ